MWTDISVFGAEHIYQTPTSIPIYGGSTPHDPEVSDPHFYLSNFTKINTEFIPIPYWIRLKILAAL